MTALEATWVQPSPRNREPNAVRQRASCGQGAFTVTDTKPANVANVSAACARRPLLRWYNTAERLLGLLQPFARPSPSGGCQTRLVDGALGPETNLHHLGAEALPAGGARAFHREEVLARLRERRGQRVQRLVVEDNKRRHLQVP